MALRHDLAEMEKGKGESLTPNANGSQTNSATMDCERGGTWTIEFTNGPVGYSDSDGYSVYGPGSILAQAFVECGSEYLRDTYLLSGSEVSTIISGFYNGFYILAEGTRVKGRSDHYIVYDGLASKKSAYNEYSHGDYDYHYETYNLVHHSGGFLAEKDGSNRYSSEDVQLHVFEFTLTNTPGRYSWDAQHALSTNGSFELDLVSKNAKLVVEITQPLLYNDIKSKHASGQVLITSAAGVIELTYYEDYIDYRLDTDNDGDFETTGTIDKALI
jgi:hypothetical protein